MSATSFFTPAYACPVQRRMSLRPARPNAVSPNAADTEYRIVETGLIVAFAASVAVVLQALHQLF